MAAKNELVIVREFDAPRELVFDSFTKPGHLSKWWGPRGSTIRILTADIKPGGQFHYELTSPDNSVMYGKFVYREIIRPGKIVFVSAFADREGNIIPTPFPIKFPHEVLNTWILTESAGKTTITLRGEPINGTDEEREGFRNLFSSMEQGFNGTFDQLDIHLKNIQHTTDAVIDRKNGTIISTRVLDAPPSALFKAFSDPENLKQWWGPKGFANTIQQFEFKSGGTWEFTMHGPDGTDYPNRCEFKTIVENEMIVFVHFLPVHVFTMTIRLEPSGNKTKFSFTMAFEDPQEVDRIQQFVVPANEENFDRLETFIHANLKKL